MTRVFKQARRNICRAIVHWDDCPMENRKNWTACIFTAFVRLVFAFATVTLLLVALLYL